MHGEVIINLSQGSSASALMIFRAGTWFIAGEAILSIVEKHSGLLPNRCHTVPCLQPSCDKQKYLQTIPNVLLGASHYQL